MKINSTIEFGQLSDEFKKHLQFLDIFNIKGATSMLLFGLYDIPLLLSLLTIYKIEFIWGILPLLVILHAWMFRLLFKNPFSTQFETILYLGAFGLIGSLTFIIMIYGISYYVLGISSVIYYSVLTLTLLMSSIILIKYQIDKYAGDLTKEKKSRDQSKYIGLVTVAPAIGYILALITADTTILKHSVTLGMNFILFLIYGYFGARFLHKYFFMKTNIDYVNFQMPAKKDYKELIKNGVEIK
ncbi:hypothetical protein [Paucisalibacillus globulus]|uniref:hypothetical protein n=1 Tax=Paucisalibacillus globulus TaxID=351095 RepID=UPI0004126B6C|nr:hypothetical protein [Paucisalibacillus globulus]